MDSWRKYGAQLDDTPMETELSSWLKEIGYKGEALKAGNLRGLCDDQEVIDALFFMMQRLRPAESARRFRTQIGKYESLDKAREASEKVIAGKLREAREDVKDYREKREGGYWECESSGKTLRGLQGALVEQESRWQYEANVTVREQRVKRRALKAATGKVKRSVEELQSRLAGLKDLVEHARQQREEKIEGIGNRPGASLVNVHSRKLMKVLRREEGRIGLAEQPLDLAQKVEGKHEKAGGSDLSADVREELEKLMKNGGAHYMSEGLHQAAINAQSKLLDFASGLDVDGGSCLEDERFGYAQPMIDRLRAQHLQEALRNEALWNEVSEKEATFSQKYAEDTDHRVGGAMDAERMEIMIKLSVARADVETIKSNIDLIRKRSGGYGESLSFQVQNLQTRCLKNAEKSAELDRAVEQTFKQILRLKSRIQKVRESDDKYYSLKIIHQCDQAIKQAQIPVDLQAEVDAMGHMKLGMHLLQNSHETGAVSQHVDRSLWGSQEAGKTHMLQCLDWSLQAKHYTQLQDGALDPKGQEIWRWLRVSLSLVAFHYVHHTCISFTSLKQA